MQDTIVRVMAREAGVRALACLTTGLVREAAQRHGTTPVATAALGYGLTGATLLGALLKVGQRVGLKVEANGPLRKLVAESDDYGRVRGYVSVPHLPSTTEVGRVQVAEAIGDLGVLTVIKDLRLKNFYEGVVPIQTGELDADLTYYLNMSEQIPSVVEIGVGMDGNGAVGAAGGLLLQLMPGQEPVLLSDLAERLDDLPPVETLLAAGLGPAAILQRVFAGLDYDVLEERPVAFRCTCSWEQTYRALKLLEREEVEAMITEGEAVVDCHFCGRSYTFDREALQVLLDEEESQ